MVLSRRLCPNLGPDTSICSLLVFETRCLVTVVDVRGPARTFLAEAACLLRERQAGKQRVAAGAKTYDIIPRGACSAVGGASVGGGRGRRCGRDRTGCARSDSCKHGTNLDAKVGRELVGADGRIVACVSCREVGNAAGDVIVIYGWLRGRT